MFLAVEVAPTNDAPTFEIPTPVEDSLSSSLLTAEEDRLGVVGHDHLGWPDDSVLGSTTISNASIVLADADVHYLPGGTTPQQPESRWTIESSTTVSAGAVNDTMTVTIVVSHGGVLLSNARSEVIIEVISEAVAATAASLAYAAELHVRGPMWAVADALKGMLYRTGLNWNSWVGTGGSGLQPVVPEASAQPHPQGFNYVFVTSPSCRSNPNLAPCSSCIQAP